MSASLKEEKNDDGNSESPKIQGLNNTVIEAAE